MPYKDPEKQKAAQRAHYVKFKSAYSARSRKWKKENRDKMNEYDRRYRARHPEVHRACEKRYRERNKEKIVERKRAFRELHGERLRINELARKYRTRWGEWGATKFTLNQLRKEIKYYGQSKTYERAIAERIMGRISEGEERKDGSRSSKLRRVYSQGNCRARKIANAVRSSEAGPSAGTENRVSRRHAVTLR